MNESSFYEELEYMYIILVIITAEYIRENKSTGVKELIKETHEEFSATKRCWRLTYHTMQNWLTLDLVC